MVRTNASSRTVRAHRAHRAVARGFQVPAHAASFRRIIRMYAIVNINGIQTRVTPDEILNVARLTGEPGAKLTFDKVLMIGDGDRIAVGQPYVTGAKATVEVLEHLRGP